jgi:hypothetical protein
MAADEVDTAYDFMAWNNRIFDAGKLRIDDMKVGPANPARVHLDADLSLVGAGVRALLHLERLTGGRQQHRAHLFLRKQPDGARMHTASIPGALDLNQLHLGAITPEWKGTRCRLDEDQRGLRAGT